MSIVIDANEFSNIVDSIKDVANIDHRPVYEWIRNGKGKLVYGGTKYGNELKAHQRFLAFLYQMEHIGKAVSVLTKDVDALQVVLMEHFKRTDYDDHHVMSILIISGCKLVCSNDPGLHSLLDKSFKNKKLIKGICSNRDLSKPKIYKNHTHKHLLCDENAINCKRSIDSK